MRLSRYSKIVVEGDFRLAANRECSRVHSDIIVVVEQR